MISSYYEQETNYTCGPACMRMVLESLGIKKSERKLVKLMKANKVRGTWPAEFPKAAEKFQLNYIVSRNSTIKQLIKAREEGYVIILCYFFPQYGLDHYSILKRITSKHIYFWDPLIGEDHRYDLKYFKEVWYSDPKFDDEKAWFFGVKKI